MDNRHGRDLDRGLRRSRSRDRDRNDDRDRDHTRNRDRGREVDQDWRVRRERDWDRDRERDRERERERERDRGRDRDDRRGRTRRKSRSRSPSNESNAVIKNTSVALPSAVDIEAQREAQRAKEQEQLDLEMERRRERVRQWQLERAQNENKNEDSKSTTADVEEQPVKHWSLENDDGEDEEEGDNNSNTMSMSVDEPSLPAHLPSLKSLAEDDDAIVSPLKRRAGSIGGSSSTPSALLFAQKPHDVPSVPVLTSLPASASSALEPDPLEAYMLSIAPDIIPSAPDKDYESEDDVYSLMTGARTIDPFGSNFITFADIMASSDGGRDHSSDRDRSSSVAASDFGAGETEAEREEREKNEFMEALRAARRQQDAVFGNAAATPVSLQGPVAIENPSSVKEQDLGRIYASDGDIVDEELVESKKSALEVLEEHKRGKELKQVDHSTIEYLPFRKNLYIVPRALSRLSAEEVADRREGLQVKVRGKGCPAPVESWEQCGLSERILQQIYKLNLAAPFPVQKQAIPAIMGGRDVISVAKTGSGKTLAFLLPMFRHIMDQPPLRDIVGPIGLIMAPARELAFQIFTEAKKFTKILGLRCGCIYGGAGVADQIADIKRGMEIAVCTPGRLIDILCMQSGRLLSLRRVTMVVIDEADRMFDMGFEPQIRMVLQTVRPDRQTILFSATFPKQIEMLAKKVLKFPLEIIVGEQGSGTVNKDITQIVEVHDESNKFLRLLQLLGEWYERGSVLVFVDKQEKCDQLFQDLLVAGYPCLSLHGGKEQSDRDHTLQEFKTGIKTVMIATSVAGRGLDVPDIVCVVNFNTPNHIEEYVHRVGRTGRAGRKGTAYTFISSHEDQYCSVAIKALERAGVEVPAEVREMQAAYIQKVDRGEAKVIHSHSGFVGKGFTFDAEEMSDAQRMQALQRKAYEKEQGINLGPDEPDDAGDEDGVGSTVGPLPEKTISAVALLPPAFQAMLERAKFLAANIAQIKNPIVPSSSSAAPTLHAPCVMPDGTIDIKAALLRAKSVWMDIVRQKVAAGEEGGVNVVGGNHFSDELDINDYPPVARRKVTQKQGLEDVIERTGVAIIQRGSYVPPNKKPEASDKRLHLLIEGPSDLAVKKARVEILRLLEEETLKGVGSGPSGGGRYSVL